MKKLMVVTALAATSTVASAFDYKFNLEGRGDFVNATNKTTDTSATPITTTEKYNNFSNGVVRLNMLGTVNENLSFRFRYRFLAKAAAPATAREFTNTTNGIDFMYVDHKNSFFTTRFGKQTWAEAAGRESFTAATDVFAVSDAFTNYKAAFGSDYRFGVTAMFKFMDTNTVNVAISNPNATFTDTNGLATSPEKKNTGLAYGIYYTGSFMNKMIQPVLAYTSGTQNGDTDITATTAVGTKDVNYTLMAYGLRSEVAGATFDLDYKELKLPDSNRDINVATANIEKKTKSVYFSAAYAVGDFTPMVAYINDKYTAEGVASLASTDYKKNSFVIGSFWKPFADANFRYHLAYTSAVQKYDRTVTTGTDVKAANAKVDFSSITFGFKMDI